MAGKKILFASKNNQAVDVVMRRLSDQPIEFYGAVRSGSREIRRQALSKMRLALEKRESLWPSQPISALRARYAECAKQLEEIRRELDGARDLSARVEACHKEIGLIQGLLPFSWSESAEPDLLDGDPMDVERFEDSLRTCFDQALTLESASKSCHQLLVEFLTTDCQHTDLIRSLTAFEAQNYAFGDGILKAPASPSIRNTEAFIRAWETMIPLFGMRHTYLRYVEQRKDAEGKAERAYSRLPADLKSRVEAVAHQQTSDLLRKAGQELLALRNKTERRSRVFWRRLLARFRLLNPVRKPLETLQILRNTLGIDMTESRITWSIQDYLDDCNQILQFLAAAVHRARALELRGRTEELRVQQKSIASGLHSSVLHDLSRLNLNSVPEDIISESVARLRHSFSQCLAMRSALVSSLNALLEAYKDMLAPVRSGLGQGGGAISLLEPLTEDAEPNDILKRLTGLRHVVELANARVVLQRLKSSLANMRPEAELVSEEARTQALLDRLGSEILRISWVQNSPGANTRFFKNIQNYLDAATQILEQPSSDYQRLRALEETHWGDTVRFFPVWATTNLSAKVNFPLKPGLFDLLILDEASQCDIPSALPLIYRSKRIVVIGDRMQLKHIANIDPGVEERTARRQGLQLDHLGYSRNSLFDVASRSIGGQVRTIMLQEHYRSHPDIITFSNEVFYANQLVIRTDMHNRGLSAHFIKDQCGLFWLHVKGTAQRPHGKNSGAFNRDEVGVIRRILEKRYEWLIPNRSESLSIGIVTPFRDQEQLLRKEAESLGASQITIGTAHKFQGDERDIMLFSPVLASGIPPRTEHWLATTANLLNVAVTRARCTLIVVGDYHYCQALPSSNPYRRLADYVAQDRSRLWESLEAISQWSVPIQRQVQSGTDGDEDQPTPPVQPLYTRQSLRGLLSSMKEYIWWLDTDFSSRVIDTLWDIAQLRAASLREIILLTATDTSLSAASGREVQAQLAQQGVRFRVFTLPREHLPQKPTLITDSKSYSLPSFREAQKLPLRLADLSPADLHIEHWRELVNQAAPHF